MESRTELIAGMIKNHQEAEIKAIKTMKELKFRAKEITDKVSNSAELTDSQSKNVLMLMSIANDIEKLIMSKNTIIKEYESSLKRAGMSYQRNQDLFITTICQEVITSITKKYNENIAKQLAQ